MTAAPAETALVPKKPEAPRSFPMRAEPRPIEKAAMILTAIGPELAAGFLRDLPEPDMERFARAIVWVLLPSTLHKQARSRLLRSKCWRL